MQGDRLIDCNTNSLTGFCMLLVLIERYSEIQDTLNKTIQTSQFASSHSLVDILRPFNFPLTWFGVTVL